MPATPPLPAQPQPARPARRRLHDLARLPLLVALVCVALLATTVGSAHAQPRDVTRDQASRDVVQDRPVPHVEQLRLDCSPDVIGDQRGILCRWSQAQNPNTRGYQLYRIVNGSPRQLLTTVGADGRLAYFDTDVSAPSTIVYGVVALNRAGRVIGIGGPVRVQVGDDIGELRLACAPDNLGDQRGVLCRWSESDNRNTRGYLLYRSVGDRPREVIARIGLDGRRAHFDTAVVPGALHTYGVVAVDATGKVLATGGPSRVQWPTG